jgi:hypothetical protein
MNLEQTIKDTVIAESQDLDGRLQQLVRAGLMPSNTIPVLRKAIAKVQGGMTLQGAERDVMANFINSMMFIVLGDDTVFNKARAGAKSYAAEETELDENAPIVAHLTKRYGDNIRKSHVMSAAKDFGVDPSKLSKAVRKKLGKSMLDEENHYTVAKGKEGWFVNQNTANGVHHHSVQTGYHDSKQKAVAWAKNHAGSRAHKIDIKEAKEKTEYDYEGDMAMGQLKSIIANSQRMHDMLSDDTNLPEWVQSKITLAEDYISTASNYMQGEMNEEQIDEVLPLVAGAAARYAAGKAGAGVVGRTVAGAATKYAVSKSMNKEEVEVIDELSKKTMGSYVKKASGAEQPKNVMSPKNVPLTKIAAYQGDSETGHFGKRFNQATYDKAERLRKNRSQGITRATDKLTKEEVEQVDEISKKTMGRYINKAKDSIDMTSYRSGIKDGTAISSSTPYKSNNPLEKKLTKRHKGISMAVKKLTKEDIDTAKSMHESYKNTFDAALEHYNIKSPSELGEEKRKEFFNHVDQEFKKGDN